MGRTSASRSSSPGDVSPTPNSGQTTATGDRRVDVRSLTAEHFERIHRAALVLCGDPWDADDLAQETFLVLSRQASAEHDGKRFEGRSQVYTWLYGILLNLERRERRRYGMRKRKLQTVSERLESDAQAQPVETPLEADEWRKSLWAVVARLPDGQRQALVLRFSEGLAYEQIAETLQCPLGTVKSRIFHGLANLKRSLSADRGAIERLPPFPMAEPSSDD